MLNHRIRILSSLLIAFIIVNLYGRLSTGPFISPTQVDNVKNFFSNLKFPALNLTKLFTLQIGPNDNNETPLPPTKSGFEGQATNNPFDFSSASPVPSQSIQPTTIQYVSPQPTTYVQPTNIPTTKPLPTATPKPPKPTATPRPPPVTSDVRPGTSLMAIFQDVSKRMCIPAALLMAFQIEETGAWISPNAPASFIKTYNTYGWWKTSAADPCKGFGYDESTGYVPADSYYANRFCMLTPGANPGQMGLFSINQWEQDTSRKNTLAILPNNIDRRVLFDDAVIFASITLNRVGNPPANCNDWPDSVIKTAAEKHQGSCANNYCADVLKYYKQYR